MPTYDVAIIGGGVNGCGVARQLAGQGLKVYLCEQNDLASGTSSASTKLIHGGLRYLEHCEFNLVRKALSEREILWRLAPHVIWPLRFVLPHDKSLRPAALLRLGLFLYDHLGGRKLLPPTKTLDLKRHEVGAALRERGMGFEYSDCGTLDCRLVVLNAMDARARGATIETRTRCLSARREDQHWRLDVQRVKDEPRRIYARVLINAGGPWAEKILRETAGAENTPPIRLVQGSHIVVAKLFEHDRAYIFQNRDGRVLFAIPFEDDFTLIGTTDLDFTGDPAEARPQDSEIDYLLASANEHFLCALSREKILWSFCGVRPLYGDPGGKAQEATRDYALQLDAPDGDLPLLSILGGKITTYRILAEHVAQKLQPFLPHARKISWTASAPLPGGDFPAHGFEALVRNFEVEWPWLDPALLRRLARAYGSRGRKILAHAKSAEDLGHCFGANLFAREVEYLCREEFAMSAEDILWRRGKLGLRLTSAEAGALQTYLDERASNSLLTKSASPDSVGRQV